MFEVSGAIRLAVDDDINVRAGYLTIAGQTAPSPGIEIRNAGIYIHASDVLVQHIAIRPGDAAGPDAGNRDALKIEGDADDTNNVVIDHVSLTWSLDEIATNYFGWDNVTYRHVLFGEPLNDSIHPQGAHGFGVLLNDDSGRGRVSLIGNLFAHIRDRAPRARTNNLVLANNVMYNSSELFTTLNAPDSAAGKASIVGNLYIDGPSERRWRKSIFFQTLDSASSIHIADNVGPEGADWELVSNDAGVSLTSVRSDTRPIWPAGLSVKRNGDVRDWVLDNVGSRPADRSAADRSIVSDARNGTGNIVDCISGCANDVGGWPSLTERRRALTPPSNLSGDTDGDGYTNLEEWLHGMAVAVESASAPISEAPPEAPTDLRAE